VGARARRSLVVAGGVLLLLVGISLRFAPIRAASPYIAYVDEGHFLHAVTTLLRDGGWDPHWYTYPQFPIVTVAAVMTAWEPAYRAIHHHPLRDDVSVEKDLYDILEPFEILLAARILSAVLGAAIVAGTGIFAWKLAGAPAGFAAAVLASLVPALVLRGSIATVDPYATLAVLACLILTDRIGRSSRPGLTALLAGAMAGLAFASKYPAVVVFAAIGVTTLLAPVRIAEKLRRLLLASGGLVGGAVLAMPALIHYHGEIFSTIQLHAEQYAQSHTTSLAYQAFRVADSNLAYSRAELGFVCVAIAAFGVAIGISDRKLRPIFAGWLTFAAVALIIYSRLSYQPFRNLLPLVPPVCIAAAIAYAHVRGRMARPGWLDALAFTWIFSVYALPLGAYCFDRANLMDSRTEAMDWLSRHVRDGDRIVVVRELAFLNGELARLPSQPALPWWSEAEARIAALHPRFVVGGLLAQISTAPVDVAALPSLTPTYTLRARFGTHTTPPIKGWWRANRQVIEILERRDSPGRIDRGGS
jgi:Dolichyl-phosphate-mannose-protein mannosyltransferase